MLNSNNAQLLAESTQQQQQPTSTMEEDEIGAHLHSLEMHPDYSWQPSDFFFKNSMQFGKSLFTTPTLSDDARREIIECYLGMKNTDYQPPDTIPVAARSMKPAQSKHDRSLKRLRCLTSGAFRPLYVLALELSREVTNPNVQTYLHILSDSRNLLLNLSSEITEIRKNIAFQAINPRFSSTGSSSSSNYIMLLKEFQTALAQQTTNVQDVNKAINSLLLTLLRLSSFFGQVRYNNNNNNNSKPNVNRAPTPTTTATTTITATGKTPQSFSPTTTLSSTSPLVGGWLNQFYSQWTTLSIANWLLQTINFHTLPPLTSNPTPIIPYNNVQQQQIQQEIHLLLQKDAIENMSPQQQQSIPGFYS